MSRNATAAIFFSEVESHKLHRGVQAFGPAPIDPLSSHLLDEVFRSFGQGE